LLRRVLYTAIPPSARVALHRQAAGMLDDGGAPVERVAEQLLAGSVGADAWVAGWMVKNLDRIAGNSPWIAVELLRRVVHDADSRDAVRETFALRLARLLFWLGRHPEAEAKIVLATTTDVTMAAEMRLLLAYIHHERGHDDRAIELLRRVEEDPAVPEEWRIRHRAAQMLVEGAGLKVVDPAATWPAEALRTDDVLEVARASGYLWHIAFRERRHADALVHMNTAIEASGTDPVYDDLRLALLECKLFTLQNLDRLAEADETVERIRGLSRPGPSVGAATHDYWRGRWDSALAELSSPLQAGPIVQYDGKPHRMTMRVVHGITAMIAAHRDDTVLLEASLKTPSSHEDPAGQVADVGDYLLVAKALGAEQRGATEEALVLLSPLLQPGISDPLLLRHQWLPFAVRLALDLDDVATARVALEMCEAEATAEVHPARADAAARWCRALMTGDADALVLVAAHFERIGRKIEHATAAEDAAVLLARVNRTDEAHRLCLAAMTGYIELDAGWDARRLESRLRPFGIRPRLRMTADIDRLSQRLSGAERTVADLVMAGWSNADIASQLRMSYDTVRTHIARVMAKLNADSRMRVTMDRLDP
jgi:DNA-binding NarL/FixJ family response regulator